MVTANPSRLLGLPAAAGHESLRVGAAATVASFRVAADGAAVEPMRTIVAGHVVHDAGG